MYQINEQLYRELRAFAIALLLAVGWGLRCAQGAGLMVPQAPEVSARSVLLQDFHSGHILVERNADERSEPASLTKMMTVYVVFTELAAGNIKLDDPVRVSETAYKLGGSRMFVEIGSEVSVENLLKGVIVQSGNDASVALAEHVAGDETVFAALMNQHARQLGMKDTHFVNATGWPHEEQYSTARDLAILAAALIRDYPQWYLWHAIETFTWNGIEQRNRNRLLTQNEGVDGIKTGHTEKAGYCLVASAQRDDMRLISVVLGSESVGARTRGTSSLLNYGFRFYETHRVYGAGEQVTKVRVWKGETEQLAVGLARDLYVTVPRGQYDKLDAKLELEGEIAAPVTRGEQRGRVMFLMGEETLAERPLIALETVHEGNLWRRLSDNVRLLLR